MATQTLATADAILKDLYRGPIIEQLNYKTYMLDRIERDSDSVDFTGRRAIFPIHSAPNFSPTSFTDGGTLATPGKQVWVDGIVNIKYHNGAVEITDQAVRQANGDNSGAFVNLLDAETKGLARDMRKQMNRQIFGTGAAGTITALASSPAASNTVTVVSTQYLRVGMPIDIVTIANGTVKAAAVTITAINRTTKVLTLSANVTATTTTDGIVKPGAWGNEMEAGLRAVASTNRTLHGIDSSVAGNDYWNGKVVDAASAVAGESLFEQLADQVGAEGQGEVDAFLTTRGIRRRLADTYQSTKRFVDAKAVEIHGGYTAIFVNEIPVISDDDVPKGFAFAINEAMWKWFQLADPDWLESKDGTVWHLADGSTAGSKRAAWQAWIIWYASLASMAPNQVGAIINAADDAATTY
jgi:energy-converting hydrogenase Eha subunit B